MVGKRGRSEGRSTMDEVANSMTAPSTTSSHSDSECDATVAPAATTIDYTFLRAQYEEHNRMEAMLSQMVEWNDQVVAFSEPFFPSGVQLRLECDPETGEPYFAVEAQASGSVDELVALVKEWHSEMWKELREASRFYRLNFV